MLSIHLTVYLTLECNGIAKFCSLLQNDAESPFYFAKTLPISFYNYQLQFTLYQKNFVALLYVVRGHHLFSGQWSVSALSESYLLVAFSMCNPRNFAADEEIRCMLQIGQLGFL